MLTVKIGGVEARSVETQRETLSSRDLHAETVS